MKHEIKYDGYNEKKTSETEYYENGKIKSATTYDYYGPTTENYDTNGKLQTRTEYDYNGKQVTTYNSDGSNVKTTYDKETNKPIKEIRTSANGTVRYFTIKLADDGSKTLTEYKSNPSGFLDSDKIGVEKYDAQGRLTYKSKYQNAYSYTDTEYIYNEDGSRREVSYDAHNNNARGNITSDKTYDKNGRLIKSASYPRNNYTLPTTEVLYSYDSNGAISTKTTIEYDVNNSKQTKKSETVTDKNGKLLSKVTYEASYQDENTGEYIYKERKIVTTNDGDKSTVTTYIANQITQEVVTDSVKNTKTTTTYKNGKKSHEVITQNNKTISEESYDKNGALQTTTKYVYSSDGNYVISVYDKNEKLLKYIEIVTKDGKTTETTKTATGATTSEKVTTKDSNGRAKTETKNYDANGKLTSRMVTWYSSNGKDYYEDTYDSRGLITKRVVNNVAYNYTYSNYVDSKNYTQTRKCSKGGTLVSTKENGVITKTVETKTNGDIETIIYDPKTGKKKVSYYKTKSTGAIKTTEYNANGKALSSFKSRMKDGNVVYYLDPETKTGLSASMDIKGLYDRITDSINTKDAIAALKKMGGDITYEYLKMAQPGYNGKPSGSDKTYVGYKNAPSNAQAHIKKDLAGTVPEYGYTPEEVKGYHYSTTSAMSKKISTNQDFTDYVKNNIKNLINGTNLSSTRLDFEQDVVQDLWGSLHGTDVVATKLEGTKLTITIYDLYDFENLQGDSNTDVLNRAGYAAMKDGKLKPYYVLIDVVIDLSKSPYNMTQAQINQIAGK